MSYPTPSDNRSQRTTILVVLVVIIVVAVVLAVNFLRPNQSRTEPTSQTTLGATEAMQTTAPDTGMTDSAPTEPITTEESSDN